MAAAASKAPKRKSTESTEQMLKKIKVAKSSERPQPVKSALKTANGAKTASPARGKTATGKPAAKVTKPQKGKKSAPKVEEKVETAAEKIAATTNAVMEAATAKAKVAKETAKKEKAEAKKVVDKVAEDTAEVVESAKSAVKGKAGKKSKKSKVEELVDSDDEETGGELTADQTAALMAGFSSSDEESDEEGIPLDKLPKANNAKAVEAISAAKELPDDPESTPGVIYVGRLPHGFQDPQMRAYFKQFGEITNLRVARNKKTYKSKHYAFVEFASSAVADIVVKAMDKYLMFNHILQVKRVPPQQVHPRLWEKTKKPVNQARLEGLHLKRGRTEEQWDKAIERENKKRRSTASKLAELGYDFIVPVLNVFGASTAVEATPDKQLLEDVKQAAEAPEKNVSNSSKKRTAASQPEKKKAKKTKAKA